MNHKTLSSWRTAFGVYMTLILSLVWVVTVFSVLGFLLWTNYQLIYARVVAPATLVTSSSLTIPPDGLQGGDTESGISGATGLSLGRGSAGNTFGLRSSLLAPSLEPEAAHPGVSTRKLNQEPKD